MHTTIHGIGEPPGGDPLTSPPPPHTHPYPNAKLTTPPKNHQNQNHQAVIDYKFRAYGRAVLKTEATTHLLLLLIFSCYLLAVRFLGAGFGVSSLFLRI